MNQPNILFIITDQQHRDAIQRLGWNDVNTPAMNSLVDTGVSFSKNYCPHPLCSPSRSAIFTGRMPTETGVYKNLLRIREDMPTLGAWFREQSNYETVYAGKWHVPYAYRTDVPGFDVISTGVTHQGTVSDPCCTRACEAFLRNRKPEDAPFLMVASYMQPHDICEWNRLNKEIPETFRYPVIKNELPALPDNFNPPIDEPSEIHNRRLKNPPSHLWNEEQWRYYLWSYQRHVEIVDGEIARLLQALEETGLRENTCIVFTSDHGESCGRHRAVGKSFLYDESSATPLVISYPKQFDQNRVDHETVTSGIDLFPTFCDIANIKKPDRLTGKSLLPTLSEQPETLDREYVVCESMGYSHQMVRSQSYKYIALHESQSELLFDMENDPGETKNLASEESHQAILKQHRDYLKSWIESLELHPDIDQSALPILA